VSIQPFAARNLCKKRVLDRLIGAEHATDEPHTATHLDHTMKRLGFSLLALGLLFGMLGVRGQPRAAPLVVHEWGTITTRHRPNGAPQGRLNRIGKSEVLPAFVHRYEPPQTKDDPEKSLTKSPLTPGRPDVTMRLETPVLYFYPPVGAPSPPPFDVSVTFRGGIVNEFYPRAEAAVEVDVERVNAKIEAGLIKSWDGAVLNNYVLGRLRWRNVALGNDLTIPRTSSHAWLAPRRVRSTGVTIPSGEGERYLFYRGVAHLDALVQTELSPAAVRLRAPRRLHWMRAPSMTLGNLWLVDIRPDGSAAFREYTQIGIAKNAASRELLRIPLFAAKDYTASGLGDLRQSMKRALVAAGLFEDEAEAMLETWKESYYRTPGLRIFYTVPDEWLSYFLPVRISIPHEMTRVLVGRIDLVRR
jgi:hypothetical protein